MVQEMIEDPGNNVPLFNSTLETGVRAVVILDAAFPRYFDLSHLTWLDHLVVHTADVGGPESLHPNIPQRTGELLVRRRLVEESLDLMRSLHLVEIRATNEGIVYEAREEASAFVETLRSSYGRELKQRAEWLSQYISEMTDEDLAHLIAERVGRWAVEFQIESLPDSDQT
jgi:hypothetical protein